MSTSLVRRLDPDAGWRLGALAVLACAGVALVFSISANIAVGLCAVLLVTSLTIGLNAHRLITALVPFAIVATLMPLNGIRPLSGASVGDLALILTGVAALPFLRRARPPGTVLIVLVGTLLVTSGGLLGMMASQEWGGAPQLARFVLGAPMVILIVVLMNPVYRTAVMLMSFYALGGFISSMSALMGNNDPALMRASGLGIHLGHLGLAALFAIFVLLGWLVQTTSMVVRLITGFMAAVCLYGMLLTGMRSAVIGLVLGMLFVAACARMKGLLIYFGGGVLSLGVLLLLLPYLPASENLERIIGRGEGASLVSVSDAAHTDSLFNALQIIGAHPWTGVGFAEALEAHNLFLQVMNLGGIIALIGVLVIWGTFGLLIVQRLMLGMNRESAMRTFVLGGVIGYFTIAQFQPLIWDRHLWFFLTLSLIAQAGTEPLRTITKGIPQHERDHPRTPVPSAPSAATHRLDDPQPLAGPSGAARGPGRHDGAAVVPSSA